MSMLLRFSDIAAPGSLGRSAQRESLPQLACDLARLAYGAESLRAIRHH